MRDTGFAKSDCEDMHEPVRGTRRLRVVQFGVRILPNVLPLIVMVGAQTIELDAPNGQAPILSTFGDKITTYRKLSEHALQKMARFGIISDAPLTAGATLPGGDIQVDGFATFVEDMRARYPWCSADMMRRSCRAYGTRISELIGDAASLSKMGVYFGGGLAERELRFLITQEYATAADDIIWRRGKFGLHMTDEQQRGLADWFAAQASGKAA